VKIQLQQFVTSVLNGGYLARNVVTETSSLVAVDSMSVENPLASMISQTHDDIVQIRNLLEGMDRTRAESKISDTELMRNFIERLIEETPQSVGRLRNALLDGRTSAAHDEWLEGIAARLEGAPRPSR
jgi:hypothetical protein